MAQSKRGVIFSVTESGLTPLTESPYDSEADLQKLLADHPDLLAGDQIDTDAPRRWVLVAREAGVPAEEGGSDRWYLDHLFLDQDGIPTLVEVKRSTDTRIRREVVAQMLDYAANSVVNWPVPRMQQMLEDTCGERDQDSSKVLLALLQREERPGESVEQAIADYWQQVKTNLYAGRVRMIFVADDIPKELRRIVEFLNGQMGQAQVLAVEVRQFVGQGSKTLVPQVIGQTSQSEQRKRPARGAERVWDRPALIEAIRTAEGAGPVAASVAERFIDWVERRGLPADFGSGSYIPIIEGGGVRYFPFHIRASGILQLRLHGHYAAGKPAFQSNAVRLELIKRLNGIGAGSIRPDVFDGMASIPLTALAEGDRLERFFNVFDWTIETVRSAAPRAGEG